MNYPVSKRKKPVLTFKIGVFNNYKIDFCFNEEGHEMVAGFKSDHPFVTRESENGRSVFIYVSDKCGDFTSPKYLQCLTHECNHAAIVVLADNGINFDRDNQEVLCYTQDYIFRKCYEFCLKNRKTASKDGKEKPTSD